MQTSEERLAAAKRDYLASGSCFFASFQVGQSEWNYQPRPQSHSSDLMEGNYKTDPSVSLIECTRTPIANMTSHDPEVLGSIIATALANGARVEYVLLGTRIQASPSPFTPAAPIAEITLSGSSVLQKSTLMPRSSSDEDEMPIDAAWEDRLAETFAFVAPRERGEDIALSGRLDNLPYWQPTTFLMDGADDDFGDDWE